MEIEDPCTFLQSFTHDPSVGWGIPQNRQRKMTFVDFTKDLVEPYILEEITRQMQDAQSHLLILLKRISMHLKLRSWQTLIVGWNTSEGTSAT